MPENDELLEQTETEDENTEPTRSGGDNNNEEEDDEVSTPNPLGKLKRSAQAQFIATNFDFTEATPTAATAATWKIIGKHVSDLSVNLNAQTETLKNILDETEVIDNGYEPEFDVDTYYATPTDGAFYDKIKAICMDRLTGDACRTYVLEVIIDTDANPSTDGYDAWVEEVIVKPTSYGGPQGGVSIPYKVTFAGNRKKGICKISDGVPAFSIPSGT